MLLCSWEKKVVQLKRTEISKAMPKGWRSNGPGATSIPLTRKCGSLGFWLAKMLPEVPES